MKKVISFIGIVALIVVSLCCLTACDNSTTPTEPKETSSQATAECVVLGIRNNFPGLGTNAQTIYDRIYNTCKNYGEVSYVVVEGDPTQTKTVSITKPEKDISKTKEEEIAKRNASAIMEAFSALKATTAEADTFSAIKLGANTLNASSLDEKNLTVYDSGLCTAGLLSQVDSNVLGADPSVVVDKLEAIHALPNLEGISVTWIGLGCVSGIQQKIPDSYFYNLKALWTEIIERSGGTVHFDSAPVTGQQAEGLPHVSAVEFPLDSLGLEANNISEGGIIKCTVKFIGDTTDLIDTAAAEEELNPVAQYLRANPDQKVIIAGTTAKIGNSDGKELSYRRSQTIMNILIKKGVSSSQMECIGLGCTENRLRVEDHNTDGSINEEMAAKNRAIYIMSSDSETAKSLKAL